MQTIYIRSLPLEHVIKDIALALGKEYRKDCDEFILELPEAIGAGTIRGINFDSGLGVVHYDCLVKEDVELHFTVGEVHPLKFIFCGKGELMHRFESEESENQIREYSSAVIGSSETKGHVLHLKAGQHYQIFSLEVDRARFYEIIECEIDTLSEALASIFADVNAKKAVFHEGEYSLTMQDIIHKWTAFERTGLIRNWYLESRAFDMLSQQCLQFEDDTLNEDDRMLLRSMDVRRIDKAMDYIKLNLAALGGVNDIAREVGTNANKLQEGFRILQHMTVNEYIRKVRMNSAQEMLKDRDYNISEIVDMLGLRSASYFSKEFKERFGMTPSDYRRSRR